MGVNDSTHPGQLLASQRSTDSTSDHETCGFCGGPVTGSDERVEHVLPAAGGDTRTERYCSPGCFVRQMERLANIE